MDVLQSQCLGSPMSFNDDSRRLSDVEFRSLVEGKRCLVLAPSAWLKQEGAKFKSFISSFDLIIKTTNMCELEDPEEILGVRCDIWYGLPGASGGWTLSLDSLVVQNVKVLRIQPKLDSYAAVWEAYMQSFYVNLNHVASLNYSIADHAEYESLVNKLKCIPFSGFFAISDLLQLGAMEVFALGHDFYRSGYFTKRPTNHQVMTGLWHSTEAHMSALWALLHAEPRFDCDINLKSILTERFGDESSRGSLRKIYLDEQLKTVISDGPLLALRTCNIHDFIVILSALEQQNLCPKCTIICREQDCIDATTSAIELIEYPSHGPYQKHILSEIPTISETTYSTLLLPYNGESMLRYLSILEFAVEKQIANVYFVSPRGAIKPVHDVLESVSEMRWYLNQRERILLAQTYYDRHEFL